jgi:hypothetical protein
VAQAVYCLPCRYKVLRPNPNSTKKSNSVIKQVYADISVPKQRFQKINLEN